MTNPLIRSAIPEALRTPRFLDGMPLGRPTALFLGRCHWWLEWPVSASAGAGWHWIGIGCPFLEIPGLVNIQKAIENGHRNS
jgi:hypothetical protein